MRGMEFVHVRGHALLARLLRPGLTVLDMGANRGDFSRQLSEAYPGSYHAVEANPVLARKLGAPYATVRNCAVTDESGPITLRLALNDEASSILPLPAESEYQAIEVGRIDVDGVALRELLGHRQVDVLKLDIEGAEINALASLCEEDLRHVCQITVEFHSDPIFKFGIADAAAEVIRKLHGHGFVSLDFEAQHRNVLFINRRACRPSFTRVLRWQMAAARRRWYIAYRQRRHRIKIWLAAQLRMRPDL